jgi:hypothetical protein
METIEIKTLIDVTDSGVRRLSQGTQQQVDQFKNWTTLKQCIELRSVVDYDYPPSVEKVDVKGLGFGRAYKGTHAVWTWRLRPDRNQVYADATGPVGGLISDVDQIPIIQNLTETINIDKPVFNLTDPEFKNTTVKLLSGN